MTPSVLAMRRRNFWEAADSGILLWKKNFPYFIPYFAIPVIITASLLLLIPDDLRVLSWLILWWLKPFFDRLCLHVVSSKFFMAKNEDDTRHMTIPKKLTLMLRGLPRILFSRLTGDLLWRRFSPFRCSAMPLRLMERLKRRQYEARKQALRPGGLNFSALLTCVGLPLEAILLGGEIIFGGVIADIMLSDSVFNISEEIVYLLIYGAYCFNYIITESLYVCMGFGVYINSRVEVEGWDIELLFKKFSTKIYSGLKVLLLVFCLFMFTPLCAQDVDPEEQELVYLFPLEKMPVEFVPMQSLNEILESDDFGGTIPSWRIREKTREPRETAPLDEEMEEWLKQLREILARGLRIFIAVILAAALIFILVRLVILRKKRKFEPDDDGIIIADPLRSRGDPEEFFKKAEWLFERGMTREAWAACLCGVINAYNAFLGLTFPPDATEYGCLEMARVQSGHYAQYSAYPQLTEGFGRLIGNWIPLAYGARNPPEGSFEQALSYGRGFRTATAEREVSDA